MVKVSIYCDCCGEEVKPVTKDSPSADRALFGRQLLNLGNTVIDLDKTSYHFCSNCLLTMENILLREKYKILEGTL